MLLDLSTQEKEGVLQVSKSRKIPVLLDSIEMKNLFAHIGEFFIFPVSRPIALKEAEISQESFLDFYDGYVKGIQNGSLIEETSPFFSVVFTSTKGALYAMPLKNGKYLIKPRLPVVQLQRHHFIFSENGFHSGVFGKESITWGVQFSYPQLFLDPKSKAIGKVEKSEKFPNTFLFHRLAKWMRDHTRPTPFYLNEKKVNQPIRLGKNCFSWINNHPGLKRVGLQIHLLR